MICVSKPEWVLATKGIKIANDDFEHDESENEGDEDSTTSAHSQTSKRQKNDESKPVGRAFRQTVLPGSDNSNSARSPTTMLKAPPRQEEKTLQQETQEGARG